MPSSSSSSSCPVDVQACCGEWGVSWMSVLHFRGPTSLSLVALSEHMRVATAGLELRSFVGAPERGVVDGGGEGGWGWG